MEDKVVAILVGSLAVISLVCTQTARAKPLFGLLILNRWLRWIVFGLGLSFIVRYFGISFRPYWALAPSFLLLWILLESVYTWLAVRALSLSDIPVYPNYQRSPEQNIWPVGSIYLQLKDEIRREGLTAREFLRTHLSGELFLGSVLYLDEARNTRLQVLFVPRFSGRPSLFLILASRTSNHFVVTDNVSLPFGGACPDDWKLSRRPFQVSFPKLLKTHRKRLETLKEALVPFGEDLLEELNDEQEILDRESTKRGILVSRAERHEYGKLTSEGRYQVWKQILLLNYFGIAGRDSVK